MGARDFVRFSRSTRQLVEPGDQESLWRFYCFEEGYARIARFPSPFAPGSAAGDGGGAATSGDAPGRRPGVRAPVAGSALLAACRSGAPWPGAEVDWHRCFQVNATADRGRDYLFCRVQIRDEELRVPTVREDGVSRRHGTQQRWCYQNDLYTAATLQEAIQKLLVHSEVPFRLRELVDGRLGQLVQYATFCTQDGPANAMVEWPIGRSTQQFAWCWATPPYRRHGAPKALSETRSHSSFVLGPRPLGHGQGWVVELERDASSRPWPGSSKTPQRRFVHIAADRSSSSVTLADLCQELIPHMPALDMHKSSPVLPAALSGGWEPMEDAQGSWQLLRDMRWTQGERLRFAEVELAASRLPTLFQGTASPRTGPLTVVLFQRDAVRTAKRRGPERRRQQFATGARSEGVDCPSSPQHQQQKPSEASCSSPCSPADSPALPCRARPDPEEATSSRGTDEDSQKLEHSCRLLLSSSGVRQFEFHPTRPTTMLAGRKDGVVMVLDHASDTQTHVTEVDFYPILGLSWLHTQPQWAIVGASQSGTMSMMRYNEGKQGCMQQKRLESFTHLSSLSVSCNDDFFMTSGFCLDVALYDLTLGVRMANFRGLHQNFINILRFSHRSPHLFATASFDHTCKVWDLRQPVQSARPARSFNTQTLNVMCCFSPDDRHVLCSGVDNTLLRFSLDKQPEAGRSDTDLSFATSFPIPPRNSNTNYRRSHYVANGGLVATAATNESLLRLYTAEAPHRPYGSMDFRNMLLGRRRYQSDSAMTGGPRAEAPLGGSRPSLATSRGSARLSSGSPAAGLRSPASAAQQGSAARVRPSTEFIQSLRCHPTDSKQIGALLSTSDSHPESYIAMAELH